MVRVLLLFVIASALVPVAACSSSIDCDCAGPGNLYFDLGEEVPLGGQVKVCFGVTCAVDPSPNTFDGRSTGSVREEGLGTWGDTPERALRVTVYGADGKSTSEHRVVPSREKGSCCGPYLELQT